MLVVFAAFGAAALAGVLVVRDRQKLAHEVTERAAGVEAHHAGEYADALKHFDYYLRPSRNKQDAEAVFYFADARRHIPLENNRHITLAISWARDSTSLDPHFKPALELLLDLYTMVGYRTESLDIAEKLLAVDPTHRQALEIQIDALTALRKFDESFAAAEMLAERYPDDPTAHARVLDQMRKTGRPELELDTYIATLVEQHPDQLGFALLEAHTALMVGDISAARDLVLRASLMPITNSEELRRLLRIMDVLDLNDDSTRVLNEVRADGSLGVDALLVAAERAWKEGDQTSALGMLDQDRTLVLDADDATLGFAAFLERISNRDDTVFRDALGRRASDDAVYWNTMLDAMAALRDGRATEAKQILSLMVQSTYRNELVHLLMGETELALGETRSAVLHFEAAVRADPRWLPVQMRLIDLLLSLNETGSAYAHAMQAQAVFPGRMIVVRAVAKTATAIIEQQDAEPDTIETVIDLLKRLDRELESDGVALVYLTRVYASIGRRDEAEQSIRTLLDGERTIRPDEWLALATIASQNRLAGAKELVERGAASDTGIGMSLLNEALVLADAGAPERGRELIEQAISEGTEGERLASRLMLARYLERIGDREASAAFAALADEYEDNARVQLDVLRSRAAWTDQDLIERVVSRLRTLTGEHAVNWRVFEARRLLTFAGDDRSAASAVTTLTEVLAVDPTRVDALLLASQAFEVLDDDDKAAIYLARAVEAAPNRHELRNALIAEHQRRGRVSDAREQLDLSLESSEPTPIQRRRRAKLFLAQGMANEAIADIQALGDDLTSADQITLASLLLRVGRHNEADLAIELALQEPDPSIAMIVAAADFFAVRGKLDEADMQLARLPAALEDNERFEILAAFAARTGQLAQAEAHLVALADERGTVNDWLALAKIRLHRQDLSGAGTAIDNGLKVDAQHKPLLTLRAVMGVIPAEQTDIRGMIITVMTSPPSTERDALLDAFIKRADASAYDRALRQLTARSPQYLPAWLLLASEEIARGDLDAAARLLVNATTVVPSDPRPAQLAAELLASLGQLEESADMAEQWRRRTLEQPMLAELFLAEIYVNLERWPQAYRLCARWREPLLASADTSPAGIELLALCQAATGRADEAEAFLLPRAEADPAWAARLARVASAVPDASIARRWLAAARRYATNDDAMLIVGLSWHQLAARSGDIEDYQHTVEILTAFAEANAAAASTCATALEHLEQWDEAERMYRHAIDLLPDDPILRNNLAYLILTHGGGSPDEAVALTERAVELLATLNVPDAFRVSLMDTLGLAYLAADRPADAERTFRSAAEIIADDERLVVGLAEAFDAQGRSADANRVLQNLELNTIADDGVRARAEALAEKLAG